MAGLHIKIEGTGSLIGNTDSETPVVDLSTAHMVPAVPSIASVLGTLNKQQAKAYRRLNQFINTTAFGCDNFFLLKGYAGTGKTYLTKALCSEIGSAYFAFTAPTNKATKVLRKTLGDKGSVCKTIYSLLGIKMVGDEDRMRLEFPSFPMNLNSYPVIFVDEGSMINTELLAYIKDIAPRYRTKWILSADQAQLPPVGEEISPIFTQNFPGAELDEVMRYDNELLVLATRIRKHIQNYPKRRELIVKTNHSNGQGVWMRDRHKFIDNVRRAAQAGYFTEIDHTKIVAWRNKTVEELNWHVRRELFSSRDLEKARYLPGDRVMIAEPVEIDGHIIAHIDDEGTIRDVGIAHHSYFKHLTCYHLAIEFDEGRTVRVSVIHEDSEAELMQELNELAMEAKQDSKKWKTFWAMRKSFHRIRFSYAMTAHRAQGSTFRNVFCNMTDIMANRDYLEALRCLYVASTRATDKLVVA